MWTWLMRRALNRWGRRYNYDVTYVHALLSASPRGFRKFSRIIEAAGHDEGVPLEALYAAKLAATIAEDCGPCTELVVRMAQEKGVADRQIAAVLERRFADMNADTALGLRFAEAVVTHDPAADEIRDEVRCKWDDTGVATLSLAIAIGRVFPMLKAGMGYARSCWPVEIGNRRVNIVREAA